VHWTDAPCLLSQSDTATVLHEALGYIRCLHEQIQVRVTRATDKTSSTGRFVYSEPSMSMYPYIHALSFACVRPASTVKAVATLVHTVRGFTGIGHFSWQVLSSPYMQRQPPSAHATVITRTKRQA
jgi:hypothetical protein